jgi:hypothetical protein
MTLKADMTTDLATFFNTDEFGESVTYTPSGGAGKTITIDFEDEDRASQTPAPPGDEMVILVKYSDATAAGRGDAFTIDSVTWYLESIVGGGPEEGIWHIKVTRSTRRSL